MEFLKKLFGGSKEKKEGEVESLVSTRIFVVAAAVLCIIEGYTHIRYVVYPVPEHLAGQLSHETVKGLMLKDLEEPYQVRQIDLYPGAVGERYGVTREGILVDTAVKKESPETDPEECAT